MSTRIIKPIIAAWLVLATSSLEAEVIVDSYRKEDKYLLIYTANKTGRIYTENDFTRGLAKPVVIASPKARIELDLHLR